MAAGNSVKQRIDTHWNLLWSCASVEKQRNKVWYSRWNYENWSNFGRTSLNRTFETLFPDNDIVKMLTLAKTKLSYAIYVLRSPKWCSKRKSIGCLHKF